MTTQSKKPRQGEIQSGPDPVVPEPYGPIVLKLDPVVQLTDAQFAELCSLNDALRIELNAQGELEILPPTNFDTGRKNTVSPPSYSFGPKKTARERLPTPPPVSRCLTARYAPRTLLGRSRTAWLNFPTGELHKFPRICPDFVVELRSPSDRLPDLQAKMDEYVENGVRLGWLIDPLDPQRRVYIYRPNSLVEVLEHPETLSGEPELPGFTPDLKTNLGAGLLTGVTKILSRGATSYHAIKPGWC